jgi:hypothetical protein
MKLRTKRGKLTAYALACGYVVNKGGYSIQRIHNQYVVQEFTKQDVYFNTLAGARKYINQ